MELTLKKKNKFSAKKTSVDGILFHSKLEARRYLQLKILLEAKHIRDLRLQPSFPLVAGIKYIADFQYAEKTKARDGSISWNQVVEDTKGFSTSEFRIKAKLFRYFHPGIELRILTRKEVGG